MSDELANHIHGNESGVDFTVREVGGHSVCQHQGQNGVLVVESGIYPASTEPGLGSAPEAINEALPFNGKQNILELGTVDELKDVEIYDTTAHEPTSFSLGIDEITIVAGDVHKFVITPVPSTKNLPVLVWSATKDTNNGEEFDVCHVTDNTLYAVNPGTSTVTAYDITDPGNIKTKTVTVNVVTKIEYVSVTLDLTGVGASNTTTSLLKGGNYSNTLTVLEGYGPEFHLTITKGGSSLIDQDFSGSEPITLENVEADLVITATATEA